MLPRFLRNPFTDDGPSLEELQAFTADHLDRLRNYNPDLRPPTSDL